MTRALGRVKTRLYNGADNLTVYGLDKADRAMELSSLIAWASDDLSRREVAGTRGSVPGSAPDTAA